MKASVPCVVLLAGIFAGCAATEEPLPSEQQADVRALPVLRIEEKIREMVRRSRDWEMAEFRTYKRRDIDHDGIDDAVLLTTFEHWNGWWRELFVCLSSAPGRVMHTNLRGKGERLAEDVVRC